MLRPFAVSVLSTSADGTGLHRLHIIQAGSLAAAEACVMFRALRRGDLLSRSCDLEEKGVRSA